MADKTSIEWTDATWNPVTGCSVVSPGCTNCYAMKLAGTRLKHVASRQDLTIDTRAGPVWNGEVRFNEAELAKPLSWRRPRNIFVCAHGDLFHESVPDEWIDRVFAIMALSPQHSFQVLTKRSVRMRRYIADPTTHARVYDIVMDSVIVDGVPAVLMAPAIEDPGLKPGWPRVHLGRWPLPNVWLGISAEDQARADERIPDLLATPAAIRFVSAEPLLGLIDFTTIGGTACLANDGACCRDKPWLDSMRGIQGCSRAGAYAFPNRVGMPRGLDWIIVGGESGPDARPMHPDWARQIRDHCAAAGVAFFFKQWGAWAPADEPASETQEDEELRGTGLMLDGHYFRRLGKKAAGRLLDGLEHNAMPAVCP